MGRKRLSPQIAIQTAAITRRWREELGLSQYQFGLLTGQRVNVYNCETARYCPSVELLQQLSLSGNPGIQGWASECLEARGVAQQPDQQ